MCNIDSGLIYTDNETEKLDTNSKTCNAEKKYIKNPISNEGLRRVKSLTYFRTNLGKPQERISVSKNIGSAFQCHIEIQRKKLPVYACKEKIINEIYASDTVLIMGETGSGKTTQIPQFLLQTEITKSGLIGITQPRRVAAITVAKRVALELGSKVGEKVGYSVRFEDCTSALTRIKYMTDGMLLREALSDRLLTKFSVLMLDEVHERTINNDILFGIVKEAQHYRNRNSMKTLKLIITSATMDIDHFSNYFGVHGMYLEGKTFPVKVMHAKTPLMDYLHAVLVTLFEIHRTTEICHDILVFLTGQEEIENMAKQIRLIAKTNSLVAPTMRVFPLYAQLPQSKQLECFLPTPNCRKIILATNIAETSITIPGIRYIVDCGFVKQKIFSSESCMDVLKIVRISQAQSWQRCGRAGRDAEGTCYRTYTKSEMESFDPMTTPEILRSNITEAILKLLFLNINCKEFDFIDKPDVDAIDLAYKNLKSLGAIQNTNRPELTTLGRQMTQFPLDPKLSKMIIIAPSLGCMTEILSLVAVLSGDNIYVTAKERNDLAILAHAKFRSKYGDHITLLNIFEAFKKAERPKVWCYENYFNYKMLLYIQEVRNQLVDISVRLGFQINSCGKNIDLVRKCMLYGLSSNIARLHRENFYITCNGKKLAKIHPSSVFYGKNQPKYILFSEIVFSDRHFLKLITEIETSWISEIQSQNRDFNEHTLN